ncbi:protein FAM3C-like [Centruroides sculpturatus]|uniref:protein FAM3C-like n=1 Tax=Centruroides sculpturatus TaxID=218467 RepID=UPI000C6E5B56|nr:protein FAM3C-like [Centruroides sculpturatus]
MSIISVPVPIKIGDIVPNCGLKLPCKDNEFSVHIYTGKDHNDQPKLCVDGKYIISKEINGGGRGINVAVIDNVTQTVVRVSHFDTYERVERIRYPDVELQTSGDTDWLTTGRHSACIRLSRVARLLLHELGSALIQNLYYRGSWFMVSQKGIAGFSPFEELHLVEAGGWSLPHDGRFCVPLKLEGQPIHPDPLPRENKARQEFCNINGNFPHFCDGMLELFII